MVCLHCCIYVSISCTFSSPAEIQFTWYLLVLMYVPHKLSGKAWFGDLHILLPWHWLSSCSPLACHNNLGTYLSLHFPCTTVISSVHVCHFKNYLHVPRAYHRACHMVDTWHILFVLDWICWWLVLCDDPHLPNHKWLIIIGDISWTLAIGRHHPKNFTCITCIILSTNCSTIFYPRFPDAETVAQRDKKTCSWVIQLANVRGGTWTNLAWFKRYVLPNQ